MLLLLLLLLRTSLSSLTPQSRTMMTSYRHCHAVMSSAAVIGRLLLLLLLRTALNS
jgi:hypothetical protein